MLFIKTLAQTRLGNLDDAAETMRKAIEETELPPTCFIAGPRRLLEPLHSHEAFQQLLAKHENDLVHGPMLGRMTDGGVSVWVRTVDETQVRVAVSRSPDMTDPKVFGPVHSRAEDDFTAEVDVEGLQAAHNIIHFASIGVLNPDFRIDARTPRKKNSQPSVVAHATSRDEEVKPHSPSIARRFHSTL